MLPSGEDWTAWLIEVEPRPRPVTVTIFGMFQSEVVKTTEASSSASTL